MSQRLRLGLVGVAALLLITVGLPAGQALTQSQPAVVSADPADTTPNVVDGKVTAILPMGNRIYVGGNFTQVKNAGDDRIIPRFHLEGVAAGARVAVFKIGPGTGERLGLLAEAIAGEGGWVELAEPILVRAGDAFVAVPEPPGEQ